MRPIAAPDLTMASQGTMTTLKVGSFHAGRQYLALYFSVESGKVTIWARVKTASGLKAVALVPTVMSSSKAQRTTS